MADASVADMANSLDGKVTYSSIMDFRGMKEIYRGRHSVVWRCQCRATKLPLVLKGYVKEKMRVRHFQQVSREIALMQKCVTAGIVRFAGSFEDAKCVYIAQEDCSGGDLFQMLNDCGGVMPERDVVLRVIAPLLISLHKLHLINVLHRDIKPENIFFSSNGDLKLGDFGLAICTLTERPKSRVGTLDYMAPEVISLPNHEEREAVEKKHGMQNVSYYGPKVDVWSVGVLAYELLVGRPPFEVEGERETALRIMFDDNIEFPARVGPEAASFIKLALTKSTAKRPTAMQILGHPWILMHSVQAAAPMASGAGPSTLRPDIPGSPSAAAQVQQGMEVDSREGGFEVQGSGGSGASGKGSFSLGRVKNFLSGKLGKGNA
mmetsp:Transcript_8120/g.23299  ORF Transcript_8120/g.23299 Transcript_8120/m.23299 type:complete len:377 (+) Transcript_8120:691-1821(+)